MSIFLLRRIQNKSKWSMEDLEKEATNEFLQKVYNQDNTIKINDRMHAVWLPGNRCVEWTTSPIAFR